MINNFSRLVENTSIIIVSYNSEKYIFNSLRSIMNSLNSQEVVVIDNNSKDKTCEIIKNNFPKVNLTRNQKNLGFSYTANQGARIAHGKYLLFLNPDTKILSSNFFSTLEEFIKDRKDFGAVGFKMLNPDLSLQPSCGQFPTVFKIIFDRINFLNLNNGIQIRDKKFYKKSRTVDWVSASAIFVKKSVFTSLGGFDENIFMYGEDIDLCFRLKQRGYQNFFFP